jgi:hypothetical protein
MHTEPQVHAGHTEPQVYIGHTEPQVDDSLIAVRGQDQCSSFMLCNTNTRQWWPRVSNQERPFCSTGISHDEKVAVALIGSHWQQPLTEAHQSASLI